MAKYQKNLNGKIYSDFAYRLGVIVQQYEGFEIKEEDKFESTLYVCALQSLSAQFCEFRGEKNTIASSELPVWGLESAQISKFPKDREINLKNVLINIRDALCHPVADENYLLYDSTSENGKISEYEFVRSKNFRITIPAKNIRTLVLELSQYLSADLESREIAKGADCLVKI
jgi:hypothetical protein